MTQRTSLQGRKTRGLTRLARDTRGNTLAMMAAAMIPVTAIAGSAVDTARMYVVKVRLQQACDAGVLAGRKFMTSSNATTLDATATTQATAFFNNNFRSNWMQAKAVAFTPTKTADQQVAGTATATVAMTVMKMFAAPDVKLNVVCEARYDVADTDVIFVLDTTGSMACLPSDSESTCSSYVNGAGNNTYTRPSSGNTDTVAGYPGSTGYSVPEKDGSRIDALRDAVLQFYDTVKANADPSTHIRYGFVTYSSTVNAGGAVMARSSAYMVGGAGSGTTNWTYQSRRKTGEYVDSTGHVEASFNETDCKAQPVVRDPAATQTDSYPFDANGAATRTSYVWGNYTKGGKTYTGCLKRTEALGPQWTYQPVSYDIRSYVAGNSIADPTKVTNATARWLGCVEERDTTAGTSSFTTGSLPGDLDPDLVPAAAGTAQRWRPMFPEVIYGRNSNNGSSFTSTADDTSNGDKNTSNPWLFTTTKQKGGWVACGKPVRRLAEMTRDQVSAYVNAVDFAPLGGTYHDTGMIWGTRMISPNGIFAADTGAWPGRSSPNRVIVFLTDGDMSPSQLSYGLYGLEYFDRRVTAGNTSPTQKEYHNARFLAECRKAAALNVDVWTVAVGLATTTELKTCATTEAQALDTTNSNLTTVFQKIAKQVAMLRVSK